MSSSHSESDSGGVGNDKEPDAAEEPRGLVTVPKLRRESGHAEPGPVLDRDSFHYAWDTDGYLRDFFASVQEAAMRFVLNYFPSVAARLPEGGRMCDLGCGPTVHVAVIFRQRVDEIHLADYLECNRAELRKWLQRRSAFDWRPALRHIAPHECLLATDDTFDRMLEETRQKVKGIMHCDVHASAVFAGEPAADERFDVITCCYTIEYCCKTAHEYRAAVRNIVRFVKPGGYFVYAGVMEETCCSFGGRQFECLYVTLDWVVDCFKHAGIDTAAGKLLVLDNDGIVLLAGRRLSTDELIGAPSEPPAQADREH